MKIVRIIILLVFTLPALAFKADSFTAETPADYKPAKKINKMKVEIWSDVMCPFCYIGKRKFEQALEIFPHKNNVEIVWKSYQLAPNMKTDTTKSINQYLAESKGWTLDYARQMNEYVTKMAAEVGLKYNMDKAIPANSFDAHRLSHLAAKHGFQDKMEEALFKAYFTEGKNTADKSTLLTLAKEIGLSAEEAKKVLDSNQFADAVKADIKEAQEIGVNGVPFFVFNRKYAVSGAQPAEAFLKTIEKAYEEWRKAGNSLQPETGNAEGAVCSPEGDCK